MICSAKLPKAMEVYIKVEFERLLVWFIEESEVQICAACFTLFVHVLLYCSQDTFILTHANERCIIVYLLQNKTKSATFQNETKLPSVRPHESSCSTTSPV